LQLVVYQHLAYLLHLVRLAVPFSCRLDVDYRINAQLLEYVVIANYSFCETKVR
jgi:hypothetical protein